MRFDTVAMIDWSGGNDTGSRRRRDAIWMGLVRGGVEDGPHYIRNRMEAERLMAELIEKELSAGRRLFVGVDFPFGYPAGFAEAVTGRPDPFALWDWLEERVEDSPKANNRFKVAGEINRRFGGAGPFWGNARRNHGIAGLPRTKAGYRNPFPDRRKAETLAKGSFTCWQLAGAGAVGSQVLTGLPVLNRLRRRFAPHVAI